MKPYITIKKAGFDILFTGILTEKIIDALKMDSLIGSFVSVEEAAKEVGKICNTYKNDDIDLTILLTHIGFESDIELAKLLKPEWGVDMIIGGHSHTVLEKPEKVNNVLIAQAGVGTNQIGRFDITVDDETNSIVEYKWQLVPINSEIAEPDTELEKFVESFKEVVDRKYSTIVTKFAVEATHPKREIETSLGNLYADAFAEACESDVMLLGSGSVRKAQLGPVVTLKDFISSFPYDDTLTKFFITGSQLKKIFSHFMRAENRNGEGECYQVNSKVKAVYNDNSAKLESLYINNQPVEDSKIYSVGIQGYHHANCEQYLNITNEELQKEKCSKVVTTSAQDVLEEYLRNNQNLKPTIEGRLIYNK